MMMLCPTCGGKGTINDPKCGETRIAYCGPNGERFPQVQCLTCGGTGWCEHAAAFYPTAKEK